MGESRPYKFQVFKQTTPPSFQNPPDKVPQSLKVLHQRPQTQYSLNVEHTSRNQALWGDLGRIVHPQPPDGVESAYEHEFGEYAPLMANTQQG